MSYSFKQIVENANDVVIVTKAFPLDFPGPEIVYVNKAFTQLTGYSKEEAIGNNPRMLQSVDTSDETKDKIKKALIKKESVRVIIKNYTKDSREYWLDLSILPLKDENGNVTHFAAIERDYSEYKDTEQKLRELTIKDPLTDLYNRRALNDMLPREFARMQRKTHDFSVLALDIDHFKDVNDTYGHDKGDEVIKEVAKAIEAQLKSQDWVARAGGEEFVAILIDSELDDAIKTAEKIKDCVSDLVFESGDEVFHITISIGLSGALDSDEDEWQVAKRADKALYDAKYLGRNRVCLR